MASCNRWLTWQTQNIKAVCLCRLPSDTKPFVYVSKSDPSAPVVTVTAEPSDPPNPPEPTIDYTVDSVVYLGDANVISRSVSTHEEDGRQYTRLGIVYRFNKRRGMCFSSGLNDIFCDIVSA